MATIVRPSSLVLESLEPRIVLSAVDGLPLLTDLEVSTDPVVVLETSFGDIFIELFVQDAPLTVENFIQYTERGQFSESLFHRSQPGFVLQGGGFAFDNDLGLQAMHDPDLGTVPNEFGRSNTERTLAMARSADPDSATSQFFINLSDNNSGGGNLDAQQFAVFGQVITNASWAVVQTIVGLNIQDLRSDPAFQDQLVDRQGNLLFRDDAGFITRTDTGTQAFGNTAFGSNGFSLGGFPVQNSFVGTFMAGDEVEIINAQVVKPEGSDFFFDQVVALPEGFRSQRASDFLEITNPNAGAAEVQVIVRYESGLRDKTIFSATMAGNSSQTITLHDKFGGATPLVRAFTPFAVEVYTSAAPVGAGGGTFGDDGLTPATANLTHFDYGGFASESFANVTDSGQRSLTWDFSSVPAGSSDQTYIVWQNLGETQTDVTVSFIGDGFAPFNQNFTLDPYRRGGVAVFDVAGLSGLPEGTIVGARVTATEQIVASLSTYNAPTGRPVDDGEAGISQGTPFQGRLEGLIPGARIPAGGTARLTALNANNSAAVIQLIARTASGSAFSATPVPFIMTAQSRSVIDLATVFPLIPTDEPFSISYVSTTPVTLDYSSEGPAGMTADILAEPVQIRASTLAHFAGVRLATTTSGSTNDVVSIFNPFSGETIEFDLTFHFSDGTTVTVNNRMLGARENVNLSLADLTAVANKAASDPAFETFGLTISGFDTFGLDARHLVAQITRTDGRDVGERGETLSFIPTLDGEILPLDDVLFDGGSGA